MQINVFLIKIDFEEYQIERTLFSDEKLANLREKYNNTHSFFRNADYIYISNKEDVTDTQLGESISLTLSESERVVSSLIKHIFFRTFKDRFPHILPIRFSPFRFYSRHEKDDLVSPHIPLELKNILSYRKQIEVNLRKFSVSNKTQFGFIISTANKWQLNRTCEELLTEGLDIQGLDVLQTEELPGLMNIMAPNEEFIGTLISFENKNGIVETSEGRVVIPLSNLYLKKSTFNIRTYLEFKLGSDKADQILGKIKIEEQKRINPESEYVEIMSIAKLLFTVKENNATQEIIFQNRDGFCFTVNSKPFTANNTYLLKQPNFIFDPAATKIETRNPDTGLKNFGPYDSQLFDPKTPKILGICKKDNRGSFSSFIEGFINGIPDSKWYKEGFRKKYDLHEIKYEIKEVLDYDIQEYEKIISDLSEQPNIVIIEIPENFKHLRTENNPYYKLKAKLLTLEIPVQFVLNWKIKSINDALLNAISLQIYAKLGGTPWVLPSVRSVDRELIIGIGHSIMRNSLYKGAEQNRIVGIMTFFSSDGQYLLSNKAKEVQYDNYFGELLKNLEDSLIALQDSQAWKDNDTIRLIFHIFKPIKNVEHDVIQALISRFKKYNIQYAFVTISKYHPFQLFDVTQHGKNSRDGKYSFGKYIPFRGSNILLDSSTCLIQLLGVDEIKTPKHGASGPLLIKIRKPTDNLGNELDTKELFTDIHYIVQQIYSFTYLSWRGFLPSEHPATMLYSNLFANLLGKLRKIDGWHPDVLNFKLKRKKWFL